MRPNGEGTEALDGQRRLILKPKRLTALLVLVLGSAVAVLLWRVLPADEQKHETEGGPLRTSRGQQGFAMEAPPGVAPYRATFGAILMCTERSATVRISRVTVHQIVRPTAITYWIRRSDTEPMAAGLGSPPGFKEAYSGGPIDGRIVPLDRDAHVDHPCETSNSHGPSPGVELLVSMDVPSTGASLNPIRIHYTSAGKRYYKDVDYTMTACGSAPEIQEDCP